MITLPIKIQNDVMALRYTVATNRTAEYMDFLKLCKRLKFSPDSTEAEMLWDHIYNDIDWTVEYAKTACSYAKKYKGKRKPTCGCQECGEKWTKAV